MRCGPLRPGCVRCDHQPGQPVAKLAPIDVATGHLHADVLVVRSRWEVVAAANGPSRSCHSSSRLPPSRMGASIPGERPGRWRSGWRSSVDRSRPGRQDSGGERPRGTPNNPWLDRLRPGPVPTSGAKRVDGGRVEQFAHDRVGIGVRHRDGATTGPFQGANGGGRRGKGRVPGNTMRDGQIFRAGPHGAGGGSSERSRRRSGDP